MKHCVYCGDVASDRDHVIPVSYTSITRNFAKGTTVPCCNHCNSVLGNKHYITIDTRALHILQSFNNKSKYQKILNTPRWTEEELEDMGVGMRDYIENQMYARRWLEMRMDNLELVAEGYEARPIDDPFRRRYEEILAYLSLENEK